MGKRKLIAKMSGKGERKSFHREQNKEKNIPNKSDAQRTEK